MKRLRRQLLLAALVVAAAVVLYSQWAGRPGSEALPALGVEPTSTGVSGLSSGAYMAGQMHLAHGRSIIGAGLVAGGPYACADSPTARALPWPASVPQNLARARSRCMGGGRPLGVPDVGALVARAQALAARGEIDALESLAGDRVYLFHGGGDTTVGRAVVDAAVDFYVRAGVARDDIAFVEHPAAGHAFLARGVGNPCAATRTPFVNDCDYDQAGAILSHLHGPLSQPMAATGDALRLFDQRPFTRDLRDHGLDSHGYVYVPENCRARPGCALHIVFHGCGQSRAQIDARFARNAGFAGWAEANDIVVLFPQVATATLNPEACWDWWGYTARDYLGKAAPQIAAVWRMAQRLAEAPAPP